MAYDYDTLVTAAMVGRNRAPEVISYSDIAATNPTRRSQKDSGIVKTAARFTSVPRKYHYRYSGIITADKNKIYTFEKDTVNFGAETFTITIPTGGGTLECRFADLVRYTPWEDTNYAFWTVEFDIETVFGV